MKFYSAQPLDNYVCRLFDDASHLEGVHKMTEDEYNEAPGMRSSAVKDACDMSMRKWATKWIHGYQKTVDKDVYIGGRALHALIADPTQRLFDQQFVVLPETVDRKGKTIKITKATPEIKALLENAVATGKSVIKQRGNLQTGALGYLQAVDMANSLHCYPWFQSMINHPKRELETVRFRRHEPSGIWLKAKLDLLIPGVVMSDWKSTVDANNWAFSKQAGQLRYHVQGAHYAHCANMATNRFVLAACEKKLPFEWVCSDLSAEAQNAGEQRLDETLLTLVECYETNTWPGLKGETLNPPEWTL